MSSQHTEYVETRDGQGEVTFWFIAPERRTWDYPGQEAGYELEAAVWHRLDDDGEPLPAVGLDDLTDAERDEIEGELDAMRIKAEREALLDV